MLILNLRVLGHLLSTPVLMHDGLLCIALRLSVTLPKITGPKLSDLRLSLHQNSLDQNSRVASNSIMAIANSGVKSTSHVTGRCALFNIKLHF